MTSDVAKIYKPAKSAMQSGLRNTKNWILELPQENERYIDFLMGWTSSKNTISQVKLYFSSSKKAIAYAKKSGLSYVVIESKHQPKLKPKSYASNFVRNRD